LLTSHPGKRHLFQEKKNSQPALLYDVTFPTPANDRFGTPTDPAGDHQRTADTQLLH